MTPALDLAACTATTWQLTPDLQLRGAVTAGLVVLAVWAASRRFFPGRRSFTVLLLVMALWLLATTLEHAAVEVGCKGTLALLAWPVILAQPVLWALFLRQYVDTRDEYPPRTLLLAVLLPFVLLSLAALSNGLHGQLYGPGSDLGPPELGLRRVHYERGPVFVALAAWGYGWLAVSFGTLVRAWREAGADERGQWTVFLAIMVVPVAANLAYVLGGWRPLGGDPTPLSYGAALVGFAWMVRRGLIFAAVPLARRLLFAELPDPVLVLDRQQRVRDANRAAEQLAGGAPPPGLALRDWPGFGAALADALARSAAAPPLVLADPPRVFEVRVRELGHGERLLGRLVQLRDVTELREQALRDTLTGLYNRRALEQRFAAEADGPLALVLLDIDHFKRINDSTGHAAGDAVLRAVALVLQDGVRDGDAVFRIGGEEFALLLPRADAAAALRRAEKLRRALAGATLPEAPGPVTLSAGVAERGRHGSTLTALLGAADAALYQAKQSGRDRVVVAP